MTTQPSNFFNTQMRDKLEKLRAQSAEKSKEKNQRRIVTAAKKAPEDLKVNEIHTPGGRVWTIAKLTPAVAEEYLRHMHPGQRPVREQHRDALARAMESGMYVWTGDPIRFDTSNRLIDGQHRLSAVVKSGVTLPDVLCVMVNDDEVYKYIDTSIKTRSANDMRRFLGQKSVRGSVIAAIALEFCDFRHQNRTLLTKTEVNELVESCEFLDDLTELHGKSTKHHLKLNAAALGVALRCLRRNKIQAKLFFDAVCTNTHTIEGKYEPIVKLTVDWLVRESQARSVNNDDKNRRAATDDFMLANKLIRAYNAWRNDEKIKTLQPPKNENVLLTPVR